MNSATRTPLAQLNSRTAESTAKLSRIRKDKAETSRKQATFNSSL